MRWAMMPPLFGNERLVRQIVLNLLSKAVKFLFERGEVVVSASLASDGACCIEVADSGIGISPEQLETIMQPFVQVDSGMNRKYEGTGLGLALVKSMAEMYGGDVNIESAVNEGTRVTARFPAERVRYADPLKSRGAGGASD